MGRVLVLGGEQWKSLSIVRSLSKREIKVDVCSKYKLAMCFFSKFCRGKYLLPSDKKSWAKTLLQIMNTNKYDLIIPSGEDEVIFFSKIKDKTPILIPHYRAAKIVADKVLSIKFVEDLGIPVPKTWVIKNLKELKKLKDRLFYPVILRPSYYKKSERPKYIFRKEDFVQCYLNYHKKSPFPLIQEVIVGDTYGFFALCKKGRILQEFAHKRVVEQDPKGSGSAICVSVEVNPILRIYSEKIVRKLKWDGVIMIEFKYDKVEGNFKFIEINGRFWGSLPLAIHAGVDFPYQLYCLAVGKKFRPVKNWKKVYSGHLLGALIYLLRVLKGKPKEWSLYYPNFFQALKNFFLLLKCKPYVFDWKDPLPFFVEFLYKLWGVIRP